MAGEAWYRDTLDARLWSFTDKTEAQKAAGLLNWKWPRAAVLVKPDTVPGATTVYRLTALFDKATGKVLE